MKEGLRGIRMYNRNTAVLFLVAIMTALALLAGCVTNPLVWSIWNDSISQFEKHINRGADVNARYGLAGESVLNLAVSRGNLQFVILLIDAGADIKAKAFDYQTLLMVAAAAGDVKMARLLIESGADVNISNNHQHVEYVVPATALIAAIWYWHPEVAQLLIEAGADVHHQDANGDTALDWALESSTHMNQNHKKMLENKLLIVKGDLGIIIDVGKSELCFLAV